MRRGCYNSRRHGRQPNSFPTIWPSANASCWRPSSRHRHQLERSLWWNPNIQVAELNRVTGRDGHFVPGVAARARGHTRRTGSGTSDGRIGRRRERLGEDQQQGHLFDLGPDRSDGCRSSRTESTSRRRSRGARSSPWPEACESTGTKLPQIRHEHDLAEEEKVCSSCGRPMDRIGEDVTRELELQPAKLEAHLHVRPTIRLPLLQSGSLCSSAYAAADSRRHRRARADLRDPRQQDSAIICRCTVWKTSWCAPASTSHAARCVIG